MSEGKLQMPQIVFAHFFASSDLILPAIVTCINSDDRDNVDLVVFDARVPRGNFVRPIVNVALGTGVGQFVFADLSLQTELSGSGASQGLTSAQVQAMIDAALTAKIVPEPSPDSDPDPETKKPNLSEQFKATQQ